MIPPGPGELAGADPRKVEIGRLVEAGEGGGFEQCAEAVADQDDAPGSGERGGAHDGEAVVAGGEGGVEEAARGVVPQRHAGEAQQRGLGDGEGDAVVELDGEGGVEELAVGDRVERGAANRILMRSAEVFEPGGVDDARRREPEGGGLGGDVEGFFSRQRADLIAEGEGVVVGAEGEGDGAAVGGAEREALLVPGLGHAGGLAEGEGESVVGGGCLDGFQARTIQQFSAAFQCQAESAVHDSWLTAEGESPPRLGTLRNCHVHFDPPVRRPEMAQAVLFGRVGQSGQKSKRQE